MVHALQEIWRVLVPGGYLIDLRPLHDKRPVEVFVDEDVQSSGEIDNSHEYMKDINSDASIQQVVESGLFAFEQQELFELQSYWDTVADLLEFMATRSSSVLVPGTSEKTERLYNQMGQSARIRSRLRMIIARYRKLSIPE